jgi:hypothetical protein
VPLADPNHRARFDRWRRLTPKPTRHLIERVLERIVPAFEAEGFVWPADYAGGDPDEIGANTIPLQARSGDAWPTAEIHLPGSRRPCFTLYFAALPSECRRLTGEPVPRERATVVYAPAYFVLCKGRGRGLDGQFGYRWFSPWPIRELDREVETAVGLLPEMFRLFRAGIPDEWATREPGYVSRHVRLGGSLRRFERAGRVRPG